MSIRKIFFSFNEQTIVNCLLAVNDRVKRLGDVDQKLEDFTDALTDVTGSLEKIKEKLSAHVALGSSANDSQHLEKIQVILTYLPACQNNTVEDYNKFICY